MVPLALIFYAAKILLSGMDAVCRCLLCDLPVLLCQGLKALCGRLGSALAALASGIVCCCGAFRRCWRGAVEAVAVPCKRCLFTLYDAVMLPLRACVRVLVVTPLSACRPAASGPLFGSHRSAARPPRTDPPGAGLLYALERSARAAPISVRGCGAAASACRNLEVWHLPPISH